MKSTNFNYNGGFPFDQSTLKRLQDATFEFIRSYARQLGCEDTGNFILWGCEVSGSNITAGAMFIDGDICPFAGATGTNATKIKKQTITTNAAFENGTNPPVFIETIAVVDATGTALSAFTRFYYVNDPDYLQFSLAEKNKLAGIQAGAQVNVTPNWSIVNPLQPGYIENKPIIENVLRRGSVILGDFPPTETATIEIVFPSVGTTNYRVRCTVKSLSTENNRAQDLLTWATADYKHDRFDLIAGEFIYSPGQTQIQNIELFYEIIAL